MTRRFVMSDPIPLGLVVATRWEAGAFLKRFNFDRVESNLYQTSVGGRVIWLCIAGVGKENAWNGSQRVFRKGIKELMSTGFCGALVPDLKVGDVITHRMASSATPLKTLAERQKLAGRASAVAVDMETQSIIEAGTRYGVPIRVLRVISDTIDDDLTPLFGDAVGFSPWRIAIRLLNPSVWPLAARLRRNSAIAKQKLGDALDAFLRQPE